MLNVCYLCLRVRYLLLLSLLFKLAWKTATLLALVTAVCCSDLTLLCIDNQHLFLQHHAAIFIPISGGKTDWPGHLPPQILIESLSSVNLFPIFGLKAYLRFTEPFRQKPDGSCLTSLFFWGNNRQHRPVGAKTILSWVRKVLCVDKAHVSGFSLWGYSFCSLGRWSLPGVCPAGRWLIPMPARQYFSTYITTVDWHQDSVQCAVLGISE